MTALLALINDCSIASQESFGVTSAPYNEERTMCFIWCLEIINYIHQLNWKYTSYCKRQRCGLTTTWNLILGLAVVERHYWNYFNLFFSFHILVFMTTGEVVPYLTPLTARHCIPACFKTSSPLSLPMTWINDFHVHMEPCCRCTTTHHCGLTWLCSGRSFGQVFHLSKHHFFLKV